MLETKELKNEELKQVSGGTGDAGHKYSPGYSYAVNIAGGFAGCFVEVLSFLETRDNMDYYNVRYMIASYGGAGENKYTVLSEKQIDEQVSIS
ncbi:MAG: hypothetical protein Q4E33_03800 [Erysipelotrichaceae bacterium]|nr:hypothetical protein [Erysipelotrichaceae bacterium]